LTTSRKTLVTGGIIYFTSLFLAMTLFLLPSFDNPPRSDYWSAFYVFQQIDASPGPPNWIDIMTFDLWQHGTFRPLSHLVPYLEHTLFSPCFFWNHILNFAAYCLSIILLYLLASRLALDRIVTAAGLTVFAFLFSHFDILTWTFQLFSILGFCAFLLGFIIFTKFLESRRISHLILIGLLFFFGMLCFEVYVLWPLAVLILPFTLPRSRSAIKPKIPRGAFLMLGILYITYLGVFILHRSAAATSGALPTPTAGEITLAVFMAPFNLFYTGIAVNVFPSLALPLFYNDNINLGGLLLNQQQHLGTIVFWGGAAGALIIVLGAVWLIRRKEHRASALLIFFLFLYFTNFFTLALARLTTDPIFYVLSQFRYQYIPNALLILMAVIIIGNLVRPVRREKIFIGLILLPILVFNIYLDRKHIITVGNRLRPLKTILENISRGIDEKRITAESRLFIEREVADELPVPCWNPGMAPFMEGTFQWFFPAGEMEKFTLSQKEAAWIITQDDYMTIKRK
jgi:hypothetical protein